MSEKKGQYEYTCWENGGARSKSVLGRGRQDIVWEHTRSSIAIKTHLHSTSPPHARYARTPASMNDDGWTARLPARAMCGLEQLALM
eukprot:2413141-Pyramimonas_sp.AAC.1